MDGDVGDQASRAFADVGDQARRAFADVVKVNVYPVDMAGFATANEVHATVLEQPYPARTTVEVAGLPLGGSCRDRTRRRTARDA